MTDHTQNSYKQESGDLGPNKKQTPDHTPLITPNRPGCPFIRANHGDRTPQYTDSYWHSFNMGCPCGRNYFNF